MNKHANTEQIKIIGKLVAKLDYLSGFDRSDFTGSELSVIDNCVREWQFYRPNRIPEEAGIQIPAGAVRKPVRASARK